MKITVLGKGKLGSAIVRYASQFGCEEVSFEESDVVIDASAPEVARKHIERALNANKPIVVATTGWYDAMDQVKQLVIEKNGFCLYSSNFSLLIQDLLKILPQIQLTNFDCFIEETHHTTKKDSPSGTALSLSRALQNVPIHSHRVEDVVGIHKIVIENRMERLVIEHQGLDRGVYAQGILQLLPQIGDKKGMFDLKEFLCSLPL